MTATRLLWLAWLCACAAPRSAAPVVRPGAPGEPTVRIEGQLDAPPRAHTPAGVRFLQNMIVHHAQAVEMVELIAGRTDRPAIRLLGERIAASQQDEMALMRRWLAERGAGEAPGHGAHTGMPGMIDATEMGRLAAATSTDFDRLFLTFMIRHHEGALAMVAELLATPGGAGDPELFQFAAHVDADQRGEIARMRRMLDSLR